MTAAAATTVPASRLVFEVDEPVLANTFIEVRGYFHTDTPDGPKSGAYCGVYRLWVVPERDSHRSRVPDLG